jgi:hypothetical protein
MLRQMMTVVKLAVFPTTQHVPNDRDKLEGSHNPIGIKIQCTMLQPKNDLVPNLYMMQTLIQHLADRSFPWIA